MAQVAESQPIKWSIGRKEFLTAEEAVAHVRSGGDILAIHNEMARKIAKAVTGFEPCMHTEGLGNQPPHFHPADANGIQLDPHIMW